MESSDVAPHNDSTHQSRLLIKFSARFQGPAYNVLRMPRQLLPAQAQVQLELCRALQAGASAAVCAPSWLQVLTMWSRGTDMAQADTPAFALHLWTRVQPLVRTPCMLRLQ